MASEEKQRLILIVEDEEDLVLGLQDVFEFEGYRVESAMSGEQAITMAADLHPDLIILDLMLPGINGYNVCEQVRRRDSLVPILILSARAQESDVIRGLESGADDYVTKPFSIAELRARVRTIFRRMETVVARPMRIITVGDSSINVNTHLASIRGKPVQLGFYEAAILQVLDDHRGSVVSRDEILDAVWGFDANPTNRTVDNFIMKLRRKLESDPGAPKHILTVYGQGYKLV